MKIHTYFLVGIMLTLIACSAESEKVKIGIMTPLSGNAAFLGENLARSAELTLEYYNLTDKYELIVEDVPCDGTGGAAAVSAATKLTKIDNVQFIIGGTCSDGTLAVAPIMNEAHVVFMTPLTGGQNIDEAGEYIFRNGPSDIIAGTKPAQEMYDEFDLQRVAIVVDKAEYTLDIATHFRRTYPGEIVMIEEVQVGEMDLRTTITKIKNSNAQAVLMLTQDGVSAAYLSRQLAEAGVKLPVFANFLANTPRLSAVAGEASEGMFIYDPEFTLTPEVEQFFAAYRQKYGTQPTIPFHTTGTRDAILLFVKAQEHTGNDGVKLHNWLLANVQQWQGFNGEVSFDNQGNSGTGFVRKQLRNDVLS
jgi:branched-chain amino acid transport system substrate-binding protein